MLFHQSDFAAWSRCAAAYGYKLAGVPDKTNSASAYGSVMHHALEVFERLRATGTPLKEARQKALETFVHFWHPSNIEAICDPVPPDGWLPKQGFNELRERGIQAINGYVELVKWDDHEMLATELSFVVPIDGTWDEDLGEPHMLGGTIDRLAIRYYKRYETVCVDDWKSGKEYKYLRQNLQGTAYCLDPSTPVLMADLTWRAIGELTPGDEVLAVDEDPVPGRTSARRRHWRRSTVTAVWGTRKPAWKLTMNDGTELVASGEHRFLAEGEGGWAWRTVDEMAANLFNPRRRKVGIRVARAFASRTDSPVDYDSSEYMAGYIAGATLGDGCIRNDAEKHPYWTIALGAEDGELLDRLKLFLLYFGIAVNSFEREPTGRGWQKKLVAGLRTSVRDDVNAIAAICNQPSDSDAYAAGWLAGLLDTDGSVHAANGSVQYWQKDVGVLEAVRKRGYQLGFDFSIGGRYANLTGGWAERAHFLSIIQPVLNRKAFLNLDGKWLRNGRDTRIVSIEPVGDRNLIDITTSTGTFIADGIVSHNCYATTKREFWVGNAGEDGFGEERGRELFERFTDKGRRFTWINLRTMKFQDGGWRGPDDFRRLAVATEQLAAARKAEIFPLSITGENCTYCSFRDICAGVGVPKDEHGSPLAA